MMNIEVKNADSNSMSYKENANKSDKTTHKQGTTTKMIVGGENASNTGVRAPRYSNIGTRKHFMLVFAAVSLVGTPNP